MGFEYTFDFGIFDFPNNRRDGRFQVINRWIPLPFPQCFKHWILWKPTSSETTLFSDVILAITASTIFAGTIFAWQQLKQSRTGQSSRMLFDLNQIYSEPEISAIRSRVFQKKPIITVSPLIQNYLSEVTKLCNFLDGVGHIIFRLPKDDRKVAIEQWAETFVRSWIRMREFVYQKREVSLGRDYVYFEWLASRSRELLKDLFGKDEINIKFYEYGYSGFKILETFKYHPKGFVDKNGEYVVFINSRRIEKDFKLEK